MKNKAIKIFCLVIVLLILVLPAMSMAQDGEGLVPCATDTNPRMCNFQDFMQLVNNVIDFIFMYLALPIVALMSAYAGVSMVISGGSPESRSKAKNILWDAIMGFLLVACSWLIIKTLLEIMGYNDTGLFF